MKGNGLGIFLTGLLAVVLAACSTATATPAVNSSSNNSANAANPTAAAASLDNRLAPGILLLEGTSNAVTADQAKKLLPLWQQIQTLDSSGTATNTDYQPVYQQIEGVLTSDQVTAIQAMSMNTTDLQNLMTTYAITPSANGFGGAGGFNGGATLSPDQLSTLQAQRTTSPGSGGFFNGTGTPGFRGGFSGTPGTPGPNGGRGFTGTGTPAPGSFRGGGAGRNMNTIFLDPLIKLLQTRSG